MTIEQAKLFERANAVYEQRTYSEVKPLTYTQFKTLFPNTTHQKYQGWLEGYIQTIKEQSKDRQFARITITESSSVVRRGGKIRVYWTAKMTKATLGRWRALLVACDYSKGTAEGSHEYFWDGRKPWF